MSCMRPTGFLVCAELEKLTDFNGSCQPPHPCGVSLLEELGGILEAPHGRVGGVFYTWPGKSDLLIRLSVTLVTFS